MPYSFKDFESLHAASRQHSEDSEADYWADAVFHLLLPRVASTERRFKGGIYLWLLWALHQCIKPATLKQRAIGKNPAGAWGFRTLPTPAHLETISPFFRELPPQSTVFYAGLPAERMGAEHRETGFNAALKATNLTERFRTLFRALRLTRKIKKNLAYGVPGMTGELPADFGPRLTELMLHWGLCLTALRKSNCQHTAIFLTYELMPDSKALVNWAREAGVRVIHAMHGQRLPTYQITNATDLILFSKLDEPWFRARVAPEVKLWAIGHPRLESMNREIPRKIPSELPHLPRIAFFSQPSEASYDRQTRQKDWRILAALKGRAEIRFRLHPRESREIALLDLVIAGLDSVNLSDAGLQADLAWCDAVASSWSTVSMEAAACGRGVFWTCSTPERYEASQELRDAGIGALISDEAEWDSHMEAWSTDGWAAPVILPESRLRGLGMIGDMDIPWLERLGLAHSQAD